MAGLLRLEERLVIARAVFPDDAHLPDTGLQFHLFDVEAVASGGHLTVRDDAKEAEIRRLAEPYLGRVPEAMGKESS